MLSLQNYELGYGGATVLRDVSLNVQPGQVVCLMGRNGVGKTTLMKGIIGLLKAKRGKMSYNNGDLSGTSPDKRARAGIGYVPQGREIFPQLSVEENLMLGLEARHDKLDKIPDIVFDMFPVLGKMLHRKGGALSGGQQQQLAIGRALASSPTLLLLDEPMEGIQPSVVIEIENVIRTLKKRGETSILLVEQSLEFATGIADHYYILDHGGIAAQGRSDELSAEAVQKYLSV
jgi:urea transport system ATP-binding protein